MVRKIDRIDKDTDTVLLENGEQLKYDILIVATGNKTAPGEVEGMLGDYWYKTVLIFTLSKGPLA